jgi:hypothetical protein
MRSEHFSDTHRFVATKTVNGTEHIADSTTRYRATDALSETHVPHNFSPWKTTDPFSRPSAAPTTTTESASSETGSWIGTIVGVGIAVLALLICFAVWAVVRLKKSRASTSFEVTGVETSSASLFGDMGDLAHIFENPMTGLDTATMTGLFTLQEGDEALISTL